MPSRSGPSRCSRNWVNQNSGTLNLAGRRGGRRDDPRRARAAWASRSSGSTCSAAGRAGHIVARHKGNGRGKRMLLIGHLDTVFEPDSPFQRWVRRGNDGEGPGAGDDKGGMAVMVAALRAMQRRRHAQERRHHRLPDRRRGGCGAARDHAQGSDRGGQEGRRRARFRRPGPGQDGHGHGLDRAAQLGRTGR